MTTTYKQAGVDIDAGNHFVNLIKEKARATQGPTVIGGIGGFSALFRPDLTGMKSPLLVSSTDGVGTKLALAIETGRYETIGQDLVAMCANDLACVGAKPLFFLDYFATGHLEPTKHAPLVHGIADACKAIGCALIGGETAEMPGLYRNDDFDLAGFVVGIVDEPKMITGASIRPGQTMIGIASSGFHSNGYSLVRKIVSDHRLDLTETRIDSTSLGDALLAPTYLYANVVTDLTSRHTIYGIAHITGGGLTENIPRILPKGSDAHIQWGTWTIPSVIRFICDKGGVSIDEQRRVFNCGIGLVIIVDTSEADAVLKTVSAHYPASIIGTIHASTSDEPKVIYS